MDENLIDENLIPDTSAAGSVSRESYPATGLRSGVTPSHILALPSTTGRCLGLVSVVVAALVGSGCHAVGLRTRKPEPLPVVLPPSPSLEQVMAAVNGNSSRIYNFQADQAVISGPSFPSLRAMVVFERPLRLRIRAGTGLTGLELDVGSNDEIFWVWVRRDPQLYFCRHMDFARSAAAQQFPLDPRWVVDALGLVELDPDGQHEGPLPLGENRLQVVSRKHTAIGEQTRVLRLDAQTAAVLEQYLYDSHGRLLASARSLRHRRDPLTGLVLPQLVRIDSPLFELHFQIDLGAVRINRPLEVTPDVWQMPQYEGWVPVDLAQTVAMAPQAGAGSSWGRPPYFRESENRNWLARLREPRIAFR